MPLGSGFDGLLHLEEKETLHFFKVRPLYYTILAVSVHAQTLRPIHAYLSIINGMKIMTRSQHGHYNRITEWGGVREWFLH